MLWQQSICRLLSIDALSRRQQSRATTSFFRHEHDGEPQRGRNEGGRAAEASTVHGPLLSDRFAKAFCILHAVPKNYAIAAARFLLPLHIVRIFSYRLLPLPLPLPQPLLLPRRSCAAAIVFWSLFASSYTKIGFAVGLHLRNCER